VETEDGDAHDVAVPEGPRPRWRTVAQTARALADGPARVVMIGSRGDVLGVVRIDAPDDDDARDAPDDDARASAPMDARDERILTLLVSAQRAALEEQRVLLAPVLESYTALARGYAEYAAQVVELVRIARDAALERQSDSGADAALAALAEKVVGAQKFGAQTK
jgi:2',3'-cyclic-nucleotide 2'-phosphodiesterase (5'-nucleotidase family)